jgi:hypothetical protein
VTNLPTLVAAVTHGGMGHTGPRRRANRSHRTVLLVCKVWSLRSWALELLSGALKLLSGVSYGPPWAHYLGGYQDRLLGGPLGLPSLRCTTPDGVKHKDYRGEVLRKEVVHVPHCIEDS